MTSSREFFDALETRSADQRMAEQLAALRSVLTAAQAAAPALADVLKDVDPSQLRDVDALSSIPITRKSELFARQRAGLRREPFGGYSTLCKGPGMPRLFASPGPIYEPQGVRPDYWRMGRALHAARFRADDLVHNAFSYHMTPGAFMFEAGAHALGCTVFPAGVGQTEQQIAAMQELRPDAYCGTPSFLRILLEKSRAQGLELPGLRVASVSGEACPASQVEWLRNHGVDAFQTYATADLGLIAYETVAREGFVLDEQVIVQIVQPGTSHVVADGEVGEVVVTVLNPDYPLIRFSTGDLSAMLPGDCPTGRTAPRLEGWLGRADQSAKVRGMFVHPTHIDQIAQRVPQVQRCRLVISHSDAGDHVALQVESLEQGAAFVLLITTVFRDITRLRAEVQLVPSGSLLLDGRKVVDERTFS
ncbi:phenylacetate--CoA ligase [Diaphorobacter sp. HDW4A]|uniref:phenylacetate--CoA ligase family protein n=1 Tax=Diaphorobacter sp. HDW4A TaxID=2714924 RepID=UPI0014082D9B|nr:AMP-binding protein [Diaphorobacter sp. HDW4A]QIL79474.1 phenylacetate--CoA ligase [Diaphorobacter sp. HDW4A]